MKDLRAILALAVGVKVREGAGHEEEVPGGVGDGDGTECTVREVSAIQTLREVRNILAQKYNNHCDMMMMMYNYWF